MCMDPVVFQRCPALFLVLVTHCETRHNKIQSLCHGAKHFWRGCFCVRLVFTFYSSFISLETSDHGNVVCRTSLN